VSLNIATIVIFLIFRLGVYAAEIEVGVAIGGAPLTFDPHLAFAPGDQAIASELFSGLVAVDADGRIVPALARSWRTKGILDRIYVFRLRSDARWSDGTELTAEDFVYSFRRALDPEVGAPFIARLLSIDYAQEFRLGIVPDYAELGIRAIDKTTLEIRLKSPSESFLDTLASPVSYPVPRHVIAKWGVNWASSETLVGSGPFILGGAASNNNTTLPVALILKRNPFYFAPKDVKPDRLTIIEARTAEESINLIRSGRAHLTMALPLSLPRDLDNLSSLVRSEIGTALYGYTVNITRPPFDKREVRHALSMSVKRLIALTQVRVIDGVVAFSVVPPDVMLDERSYVAPFALLNAEEREAIAIALLNELGIGYDNPLHVRLAIPSGQAHRAVAEVVSKHWAEVGIQTTIIQRPFDEHWQALRGGNFDVAFSEPVGSDRLNPAGHLMSLTQAAGPNNYARYNFPEFDRRFTQADGTSNEKRRYAYLREAERLAIEDQVIISLFHYTPAKLVAREVKGWQGNSRDIHPLSVLSLAYSSD